MLKNYNALLLITFLFMVITVISPEILNRAVNLSLAVSFLTSYIQRRFTATSTQKIWLNRIQIISVAAAAVFLVFRFYYIFTA